MSSPKRWIIISLLVALGLASLTFAWSYAPLVLKFREARLHVAYNAEIRRYLAGTDSLSVAAHRLASIIEDLSSLASRQGYGASSTPGSLDITVNDTPDIPRNDPRVLELELNAHRLARIPGMPESIQSRAEQAFDSIIQAKGFRSVR